MTSQTLRSGAFVLAVSVLGVLAWPMQGHAQVGFQVSPYQKGHYYPGVMNVRDLAAPAPGYYLAVYNFFGSSGDYIDRNGNKVTQLPLGDPPVDVDIGVQGYAFAPMFAWVFDLGAGFRYAAAISPSLIYSNAAANFDQADQAVRNDGSIFGFGDIMVAPAYFFYADERFNLTAGYGFFAPSGKFSTGGDDNIGLGHWTHMLQLAGYLYFFQQATALMVATTFEFTTGVYDVDLVKGNRFTVEYGLSQYLLPWLELSVFGGHNFQISEDSGSAATYDTSVMDRKSVVGGAAGLWVTEFMQVNFRGAVEYDVRQGFQSTNFGLNLAFILGLTPQQEGPFPWFERVEQEKAKAQQTKTPEPPKQESPTDDVS